MQMSPPARATTTRLESGVKASALTAPMAASTAPAATAPGTGTTTPPATPVSTNPNVGVTVPRNPIVFVHGIEFVGQFVGGERHFIGVPQDLRSQGATVLRPTLPGLQSIDTRARALKDAIETAFPDPAVKLNLVAHSMGGLDARYMITHLGMGPRVLSLTTISTPHQGTPISDAALGILPGNAQRALDSVMNLVGWDMDFVINTSEDYVQNTFNPSTPDDPAVFYQSWAGKADPFGLNGGYRCRALLLVQWGIVAGYRGDNDGLIPVQSAQYGLWRGELAADHMAESGIDPKSFDHQAFYRDVAQDLAQRGF